MKCCNLDANSGYKPNVGLHIPQQVSIARKKVSSTDGMIYHTALFLFFDYQTNFEPQIHRM